MQGRFSPLVSGRIQAFPWSWWKQEFILAKRFQFSLMEWTLDQDRLYENPLMTFSGQAEIRQLCRENGVLVHSLTGDCFMQKPFWKASQEEKLSLLKDFRAVLLASSLVGIKLIVIPLVDNGRIENREQENHLVNDLEAEIPILIKYGIKVVFESDFSPTELTRFINRLDKDIFGINYDIGNSASLGMNPNEELAAYGDRILNVHIKDRVLGGGTVPLGLGDANFSGVFAGLAKASYTGNYILQTARSINGQHAKTLCKYRDMCIDWIKTNAS
jgi:hexulose-6-phosphate isomerase